MDGQVTQHLSPFEQNIVSPMMKDVPKKVWKKVSEFGVEAGPAVVIGLVVFFGAEWYHAKLAHDHRD